MGIADLIVMAMKKEGLSEQDACDRISLCDSQGLVTTTREDKRGKDPHKEKYAKNLKNSTDLAEIVEIVEPTAIIGMLLKSKQIIPYYCAISQIVQ